MNNDLTLKALERIGLLRRVGGGSGDEYAFHHVLSQEAAYGSMLKSDRTALHRNVAAVIEALPDPSADTAAALVFHYERSGDDARLFDCATRAGDDARRRYANREALDYFGRAIAAAGRLNNPALLPRIRAGFASRGSVFRNIGDPPNALRNFQEMAEYGARVGDTATQIEALNHINTIRVVTPGAGTEIGTNLDDDIQRAVALAETTGDTLLRARATWNSALRLRFSDLERATGRFEEALAIALADPDPKRTEIRELIAMTAADIAVVEAVAGHFRQSRERSRQAVEAARALDNGALLADTLGDLGLNDFFAGDPASMRAHCEEGYAISKAAGNPWGLAYTGWPIIDALIDEGRYDRALADITENNPRAHESGFPIFIAFYQSMLNRLACEMGDIDGACATAFEAEARFLQMQAEGWTIAGLGMGACAALRAGDTAAARAKLTLVWPPGKPPRLPFQAYRWVIGPVCELALQSGTPAAALPVLDWYITEREDSGARRLSAEGRYWRGRMRTQTGDLVGAADDLAQARAGYEEIGARGLLWRLEAAQAQLSDAAGDGPGADRARAAGRALVQTLSAEIADPGRRAGFLKNLAEFDHD
ncbi:MAG: hypothetical protein ABIQ99_08595 [Thermoflexales bacterium]